MTRLEDIVSGIKLTGLVGDTPVTVMTTTWHGNAVLEITFQDGQGELKSQLLYRQDEPRLTVVDPGLPWSYTADAHRFRLVSEAYRIQLAHLFDPYLAIHKSALEPLPHQIAAVYHDMLPRQPLRYLLADDPGAGKTIMTGLLITELLARGDIKRCLIVAPGSLELQWQNELQRKFNLQFELLTDHRQQLAPSRNVLADIPLCLARLDQLARNEDLIAQLKTTRWDLIVCDEAHKMSATVWGREVKYTKRFKLGRLLSAISRHFLLLTATPHNGKEEEFQLFMSLIDPDRFLAGSGRNYYPADIKDLMRRRLKEELLRFDGTPLFPERFAYTVNYDLSDLEAQLYAAVTDYVRQEFDRAEQLTKKRKTNVAFALITLQRRLASSPEAIYQSLNRRRQRLQMRLAEEEAGKRLSRYLASVDADYDDDD
ncbi:MAG TPA: DEAD/DEAH box helicase, partial [bacterium]|nr:DEAD/DEAH box helicase [bacterium]